MENIKIINMMTETISMIDKDNNTIIEFMPCNALTIDREYYIHEFQFSGIKIPSIIYLNRSCNLPRYEDGTYYIVPMEIFDLYLFRSDLMVPDTINTKVENDNTTIYCERFITRDTI